MMFKAQHISAQASRLWAVTGVLALALVILSASVTESSAQVVRRGVQGGLLGAGIGAIVDGKKGALRGAAVGAVIGGVVGAVEKKPRAHPAPRTYHPPRHVSHGYDRSLVYNVQLSLQRLGYEPGPVDGAYGPRTADAIRAYQYNNKLAVTGQPTAALHHHMVQHGG